MVPKVGEVKQKNKEEDRKEKEEGKEKKGKERERGRIDLGRKRRNRGSWLVSPEVHGLEILSEDETEDFCSETSP